MILKDLYPQDRILDSFSGITFMVVGKSPYGEGILLITDKVIALGAMDAPEPDSEIDSFRVTGNNDYVLSNLHQWLNSDKKMWFCKTHETDTPPSKEYLSLRPTLYDPIGYNAYDQKYGFLTRFSSNLKSKMKTSLIPCSELDGSCLKYINTTVFIPSAAELGYSTGVINEGDELPLFKDFRMRYASPSQECLDESEWHPAFFRDYRTFWYWLRTPNTKSKGFLAYSHFINPFSFKFACSPWMGIRPIISLDEETEIEASESVWGIYRIKE